MSNLWSEIPESLVLPGPSGPGQGIAAPSFVPAAAESSGFLGGLFSPGGLVDKLANSQNPLLKDSGLPPWAKMLLTGKVGVSSGNSAFGINMTGMGDNYANAQLQDMLSKLSQKGGPGGGGAAPTIMRNAVTETRPGERVRSFDQGMDPVLASLMLPKNQYMIPTGG